ncbi:hypothetical protein GALMADRAFT_147471 [Galerina marginata CBS 339.88]|uniref:F-box domain-containing protein n=1 Tax=Galerina marginata (strain CBS 339.88) TaxID=685588 RepID=A0A067SAR2_GALM3|nr:hypothetical protein GALMADRAFT_147471 [Galerina marginata CBS 339.88]
MGNWDELCLLCGISPIPPSEIYTDPGYGAEDLGDKIIDYDPSILSDLQLDKEELVAMLLDALELDLPFILPEWKWVGFTNCVAIGHFSHDGDTPHQIVGTESGRMRKIPDGTNVETRIVRDPSCGEFYVIVQRSKKGQYEFEEVEEAGLSRTSSSNYMYSELRCTDGFGNFFLSEGCFYYLQAWLDVSGFVEQRAGSLSFGGELFEVVNSRMRGRVNGTGILPWMEYDGIENTLEQTQYNFEGGLKIPKYTTASIRNECTPKGILDAIIRDCRCWRFIAPNLWPSNSIDEKQGRFRKFPISFAASNPLTLLPIEILSDVLACVDSLQTYLAVARTSRSIYNVATEDSFFSMTIKRMSSSPSGCLFWLLPVSSMRGELQKANLASSTFLPKVSGADNIPAGGQTDHQSPFLRLDFHWISFVRACYASCSMMNRKRIWGQVKQLEEFWRNYRLYGWEVDRFGVALE